MVSSSMRIFGLLVIVAMLLPGSALAAPGPQGETVHVVQWGETLLLIAERYGVTVDAIMAANGLSDPNFVYVGQRLIIPAPRGSSVGGQHVVVAGETLTSIAFRYGTSVAALASANGLRETDLIYVGQVVHVPGGGVSGPGRGEAGCGAYHAVAWGETLTGIARQYQTTVNALSQANNLYSDIIFQGQRLCVPPGGVAAKPPASPPQVNYYTVRPGDTLMSIASRFDVSQAALMEANNLPNPGFIHEGQRLIIPEAAPRPPQLSLKPAKIVFARWDGYKHDLYIANIDGRDERPLLGRAAGPSWSPGGGRISIFGEPGIDHQVINGVEVDYGTISDGIMLVDLGRYTYDPNQLQLTQIEQEGSARATAWAPNGKMIAWDARPGGGYRIYFWGEPGTPFDAQSAIEIPGEQPDWSPDGSQLVYRSGRDGKQGLWISDRFDSVAHRITVDGTDSYPRWSPDGQWIVFQREADGNVDLYLMTAPGAPHPGPSDSGRPGGPGRPPGDGQAPPIRRLTDAPGADTLPAWTPDGHIVFRSTRMGSWAIFVMKPDGGGQQPLIPNADPGPDWGYGRMDVFPIN